MNALSAAGAAAGRVHFEEAVLLTSHFPCLMCYHAAKWARIGEIHYLFDYAETEAIFGFRGDSSFLSDLGLRQTDLEAGTAVRMAKHAGPAVERLYRGELVRRWRAEFAADCLGYDI
jgi:tRNA(Arg) A34 adenosine deaminase TadA